MIENATTFDIRLRPTEFELAAKTIELLQVVEPGFSVDDALDAIFLTGLRTITDKVQTAIDKAERPGDDNARSKEA